MLSADPDTSTPPLPAISTPGTATPVEALKISPLPKDLITKGCTLPLADDETCVDTAGVNDPVTTLVTNTEPPPCWK